MTYIAHIRQKDNEIQTVQAHLIEVRLGAEQAGEKIGIKNLAGITGLLHDMGKNTELFRDYIQEAAKKPRQTSTKRIGRSLYCRRKVDP